MQAFDLDNRPVNTKLAINPKIREWEAFCNHVYPEVEESKRFLINHDNSYKFILYQAFRPKKDTGGVKKRRRGEAEELEDDDEEADMFLSRGGLVYGFSPSTYDGVMEKFSDQNVQSLMNIEALPHPPNPVGYSQVNTYKAALFTIHNIQKASGKLERQTFSSAIWGHEHEIILSIVKQRKGKVATARFDEKMVKEATPYTLVELIPNIENALWSLGCGRAT